MKLNYENAGVNDYNLYHATDVHRAVSILKQNRLILPLAETNEAEARNALKLYYMSFARSINSGYISDRASGLSKLSKQIVIVFDQKALKNIRGTILKPIEYWNILSNTFGRPQNSAREMEERLC